MYQITDSVLKNGVYSAFAAQTREFRHRLSFGEGFGENFIKQTSFEEGITKIEISQEGNDDSSGLVFGSCCASSCVAEFYNPDKTFNYNKKTLFVECGIKYPVEISYESKAGGYYLTDNGKWVSSEGYYIKVTNLIPVFEGDKFQYTGRGEWGGASVIWYDTDKKYLSGSEYANEETKDHVATVVIEAPEGAAWAMFQTFDFDEDVTLEVSKLNDSFFYIPCGYYKVDKPETDDDWHTVKVTAYDAVDDMTDKWNTNITFPTNAYILLDSTVEKHNLELDIESDVLAELRSRTVTQEEALTLTAYTEREVCGFLAGLVGANARVNTAGKLAVRRYQYFSTDDFSIPANVQWQNGFKKTAEEEFMIHSVTSGIDDAVFTAGTGAGISFANPIITEDEITTIYGLYAGISFQPSSCEWRGNPCVECGDTVIVTDKNGNSYTVFVASQDIDLTGGLSMHMHCPNGDADISFDTVDERTRAALNRQYTALQQAIIDASNAINGALGGHYEVVDSDNDGNPDGWLIKQNQDGTGGLIRANYEGIGLSSDGGVTYRTAITHEGINADCINTGKVKAEFIETENLLVGMSNVDGLDNELADLLTKANTANSNASTALSTANIANENANASKLILAAVTAQENNVTVIKGSSIATGSIGAVQIAAEAITTEKLSVGKSLRENILFNYNFADEDNEDGISCGWKAQNGKINLQDGNWITFKPNNNYVSGIYQKVWLKPGQYSLVARINPYNISLASTPAYIGYVLGDNIQYDITSLQVDSSTISNGTNSDMNIKYVFTYDGEEGFVNVGVGFRGFNVSGYFAIVWVGLFEADEEIPRANFFCSNKYWLKTDYRTSNLLTYSSDITPFQSYVNPFWVDKSGTLDVISGTLGCLDFSRNELVVESHVAEANLGLTYDGSLVIKKPLCGLNTGLSNDVWGGFSEAVAPSITITQGGNVSLLSVFGYACKSNTHSSSVRPQKIETTGTMKCSNCDCTSREKYKKQIVEKSSVLDKFKSSKIYEYNLNIEKSKRKTGFIVERETPEEIISDDGDGINLYSMASINWKATQEILERLEAVEKVVKTNA